MVKRWSFDQEGESIQWACLGELEQQSTSTAKTTNEADVEESTGNSTRPTFGPFARSQLNPKFNAGPAEAVPAVFIFLRSIGKIYLLNGVDYTFSLPFIVRKAWPISPHGVMIQRVLESTEVLEAEESGDDVLPTIFTVTSPFAEAAAVGLTTRIIGPTQNTPASLKDEEEHSTKPLKSIPPTEMIVWASHQSIISGAHVVVTVDVEKSLLSIWRYVFIKPKDAPASYISSKPPIPPSSKRQSMSGVGSRRTSALFDNGARDRIHPMSPSSRSREPVLAPEIFDLADMPPLSSLPGMAPSLTSTTTMASLVSGATASTAGAGTKRPAPQRSGPIKARRNSLSRNDLSTTMDRMALGGGRLELDSMLPPPDHGRMKAAYWMESVLVHQLHSAEYVLSVSLPANDVDLTLALPQRSILAKYQSVDIRRSLRWEGESLADGCVPTRQQGHEDILCGDSVGSNNVDNAHIRDARPRCDIFTRHARKCMGFIGRQTLRTTVAAHAWVVRNPRSTPRSCAARENGNGHGDLDRSRKPPRVCRRRGGSPVGDNHIGI
jgi:anaphase-promoting complex subunit 1